MLSKNKKRGQSTAEYAILIGVVISAIIGMQVFIGDRLKARMGDALDYMDPAVANYFTSNHFRPPTGIESRTTTTRYSPERYLFLGNATYGGIQRREFVGANEEISRTGNQIIDYTP